MGVIADQQRNADNARKAEQLDNLIASKRSQEERAMGYSDAVKDLEQQLIDRQTQAALNNYYNNQNNTQPTLAEKIGNRLGGALYDLVNPRKSIQPSAFIDDPVYKEQGEAAKKELEQYLLDRAFAESRAQGDMSDTNIDRNFKRLLSEQ